MNKVPPPTPPHPRSLQVLAPSAHAPPTPRGVKSPAFVLAERCPLPPLAPSPQALPFPSSLPSSLPLFLLPSSHPLPISYPSSLSLSPSIRSFLLPPFPLPSPPSFLPPSLIPDSPSMNISRSALSCKQREREVERKDEKEEG